MELISDNLLPGELNIPETIVFQRASLRQATAKRKASVRVSFEVKPSKIPKRTEMSLINDEILSEDAKFRVTIQQILDNLGEQYPSTSAAPSLSPLKTRSSFERPQFNSTRKDPSPKQIKANLDGEFDLNWGGARPGSGRRSNAEKKGKLRWKTTAKKLGVHRKNFKK